MNTNSNTRFPSIPATTSCGKVRWDQPLQTRDGRPARLLGMLLGEKFVRAVAVREEEGYETLISTRENGAYYGDSDKVPTDIFNVPPDLQVENARLRELLKRAFRALDNSSDLGYIILQQDIINALAKVQS